MSNIPSGSNLRYRVIKGLPIVYGFAIGQVVDGNPPARSIEHLALSQENVEDELQRLQSAIDQVCGDLSRIKLTMSSHIDSAYEEIFTAQQMILKDIDLYHEIEQDLRHRLLKAEGVIQDVFLRWEDKFRSVSNPLIQSRADDIKDISRRLQEALQGDGNQWIMKLPPNTVLFIRSLLPSVIASMNVENLKAIVTQEGAVNSHSAILARALDIPFVSNINVDQFKGHVGESIVVDGKVGRVIINPKQSQLNTYLRLIGERFDQRFNAVERLKNTSLTKEGEVVKVRANASSLTELRMAKEYGADGIGLYRIEALYMGRTSFPTEEELYAQLKQTLEPVRDFDITLRLLDIGGDKTLPYWNPAETKNPALGLNGIRLLLKYPHLLEMQARVILRLSASFNIKVLVSMVSLPSDMIEVRRIFAQEKDKLCKEGIIFDEHILIGAMIETPAALLAYDELLDVADFFNIGTNDLVQYVMAAARESVEVANYYEAGNHLILHSLKSIIYRAKLRDKECRVCGELAGNLNFTKELLAIGLKNFSVQPILVTDVKDKIAQLLNNELILNNND